MVNSISKTVQELVNADLSLQNALERGYGNYSAIARMLKPKVEENLARKVKLESIITAVKRCQVDYTPVREDVAGIIADSVINLRTGVAKIAIEKTKRTLENVRKALTDFQGEFLQILEGISAITLIIDQNMFEYTSSLFWKADILEEKRDLAAIIVRSPREITYTPGCLVAFYNSLARRHINIEETISCSTDTIIVLSMESVGKAFTTLTDLISETRKATPKPKSKTKPQIRHET